MARRTEFEKSGEKIEKEGRKQCLLIYSATGIALWRNYGKRKEAITNLFNLTSDVWIACAKDYDHSMIEMCELETGIEIQNGSGTSWRDVPYLNGSLDPGKMSYEQLVYMRQQQVKWVRPQVMACMMVSLHRKYGYGFERCSRLYNEIQEIEREYKCRPERIRRACYELTGIDVAATVTTQREGTDEIQRDNKAT